ncbi:PREDICTED: uncharacterized protein LOC108759209 isoform X2 [Trachymyrmex cornetzi]|uniref:uncharacterized protein LOC108759209 isoform X2 n=1 Tax=Trachymyrmex cornetzi TaxID=471704 RepID=UPI00084F654E|nr:PREDICTED: uncharacterized protein LOC108759209 isoform X2 [Trachymyrmex cornetzi]
MQLCQDPIQQILEEEKSLRKNRERRLPPITEFQRDCLMCSQDCDVDGYAAKLKKHICYYIVGIVGIVVQPRRVRRV